MPIQNKKEPQYQARPADIAVARSEKKMGAMSIIAKTQIKVWKAMLFSLFFAGFIGALAWAVATDLPNPSDAANGRSSVGGGTNIAPLARLKGNSFAMRGQNGEDGWTKLNDSDASPESVLVRTSRGEAPSVDLELAGNTAQPVNKLAISINPDDQKYTKCGLNKFTVMSSLDGVGFAKALEGNKTNTSGAQEYSFPANWRAKVLRVLLESNHGNPDWICLKEIKVIQ